MVSHHPSQDECPSSNPPRWFPGSPSQCPWYMANQSLPEHLWDMYFIILNNSLVLFRNLNVLIVLILVVAEFDCLHSSCKLQAC